MDPTLLEEAAPRLLRWAWGKTGCREQAEDLAQEVWLQYLSAARREEAVGNAHHQAGNRAMIIGKGDDRQQRRRGDGAALGHAEQADAGEHIAQRDAQRGMCQRAGIPLCVFAGEVHDGGKAKQREGSMYAGAVADIPAVVAICEEVIYQVVTIITINTILFFD